LITNTAKQILAATRCFADMYLLAIIIVN